MFFFIIWGSKARIDSAGCVGDKCPCCRTVRPFEILEVRKIPHVYYIPLGSGTVVATVRRCAQCRSEYHCTLAQYEKVLPLGQMTIMSPMELARRTNIRAVEEVERMDELKRMASGQAPTIADQAAPPAPDADFLAVYELLRDYADDARGSVLLKQAQMWASLPTEARQALRKDAEAFVEDKRKWQMVSAFTNRMAEQVPTMWGQWVAIGGFTLFFMAGIFGGIALNWNILIFVCIGLAIACIVAMVPINRRIREKWVHQSLLPKAREDKIALPYLVAVMEVFAKRTQQTRRFAILGSCHKPLCAALKGVGEG